MRLWLVLWRYYFCQIGGNSLARAAGVGGRGVGSGSLRLDTAETENFVRK